MGTLDPRDQNEQKSLPREVQKDPEAAKIGPWGGAGGVQMPPGAAKIGPWEVSRGPGDAKMIIQRFLWFAKRELGPPRCGQKVREPILERLGGGFGVPKTDPKRSQFGARGVSKFRTDYGPVSYASFDHLGGPK